VKPVHNLRKNLVEISGIPIAPIQSTPGNSMIVMDKSFNLADPEVDELLLAVIAQVAKNVRARIAADQVGAEISVAVARSTQEIGANVLHNGHKEPARQLLR
jgi:hypothetical protein